MSNFYDNYKARADKRKIERKKQRQAINFNLNSNDVLSTKAMVLILMSLTKDCLLDIGQIKDIFDDQKLLANSDRAEELIKMIEQARAEGKDLNLAIAQSDKFKEILKEFDPARYEDNLREIKDTIESGKKDLNLEDILADNTDIQQQSINKNTQKQSSSIQKQRQN